MSSSPDPQKVLGQGLVKAVKLTELGEVLKGPELLFLFSKKFSQIYKDGILNLEVLYQELRTTKDVKLEVLQGFMLWFKEQEASLGTAMQLPADLLIMPADRRDKLKAVVTRQVEARLAAHRPPEPAAQAQAQARVERIVLGKRGSRFKTGGLITVGVLALASIGINIQQRLPVKPDLQLVTQVDLAALQLPGRLVVKQDIYVLRVTRTAWDQIPRDQQGARLKGLQLALTGLGMKTLIVIDETSWHTLVVGGPSELSFIGGG